MELPEVVEFARNFAVMVRIQGPDPKGLKMRKHAFYNYHYGTTILSASGMLLPNSCSESLNVCGGNEGHHSSTHALVVTVASIVEPFLSPQHRENSMQQVVPELISGAQIDVMVEGKMEGNNLDEPDRGTPEWLPAKILALVDVPASSLALQSLIEAPGGSLGSWEVGWSLGLLNNGPEAFMDGRRKQVGHDVRSSLENHRHSGQSEPNKPSHMSMSTIRIAFLGVSSVTCEGLPDINIAPSNKRGDLLLSMGSPFGILSPTYFFNSISVGSISNFYQSSASNSSLLMADIRCLPGMEGGPVFSEHAHLIGILNRPLRQRAGGAEIQLNNSW